MVVLSEGVVNDIPVNSIEPPEEASYHRSVFPPVPGVALNATVPGPQRTAFTGDVGTPGPGLTVATTAMRADILSQPVVELYVFA